MYLLHLIILNFASEIITNLAEMWV